MTTKTFTPRPDKVATVEEITAKLNDSVAVFVSEYRGMSVGQLADLRAPLRDAGAEHKVYKNTLARIAATNAGYEDLNEHLLGPTALTFVTGDSVAAAKALLDQSKANPLLVIKGGMLGDSPMSADDVKALAESAVARRTAGPSGRRVPGAPGQDRRSAPGAPTQLRVRPVGTHRTAVGRRGLPEHHPSTRHPRTEHRRHQCPPRKKSSTRSAT
jgi:large subunit ribosomal protein L10